MSEVTGVKLKTIGGKFGYWGLRVWERRGLLGTGKLGNCVVESNLSGEGECRSVQFRGELGEMGLMTVDAFRFGGNWMKCGALGLGKILERVKSLCGIDIIWNRMTCGQMEMDRLNKDVVMFSQPCVMCICVCVM